MSKKSEDVLKAWVNGARCQYKSRRSDEWIDMEDFVGLDHEYRLKPSGEIDEQTDDLAGICMEVEA